MTDLAASAASVLESKNMIFKGATVHRCVFYLEATKPTISCPHRLKKSVID